MFLQTCLFKLHQQQLQQHLLGFLPYHPRTKFPLFLTLSLTIHRLNLHISNTTCLQRSSTLSNHLQHHTIIITQHLNFPQSHSQPSSHHNYTHLSALAIPKHIVHLAIVHLPLLHPPRIFTWVLPIRCMIIPPAILIQGYHPGTHNNHLGIQVFMITLIVDLLPATAVRQ
jgi:hypothetical protein